MIKLFTPAIRISIILVLLTLSILFAADHIFKFSEGTTNALLESRKVLFKTLVYPVSFLIHNGEEEALAELISVTVEHNPDLLSMALHDNKGRVSILTGDHEEHWVELAEDQSTITQAQLPVFDGEYRWGTLQVRFQSGGLYGALHLLQNPFIKLTLFVSLVGFLVYLWFIKKALQYIDPSALIPERVKAALDSLTEGVMLVDMEGYIVLANATFENVLSQSVTSLMGQNVSDLNWKISESEQPDPQFPWIDSIEEGQNIFGSHLVLIKDSGEEVSFNVNSSPIYGGKGDIRGAIVSFSDVTEIEQTNKQLIKTMEELDDAHKEVLQKNKELKVLATRDPLTGCLNRRAFLEIFYEEFVAARGNNTEICCIMGDIDLFKNINDTHGHSIGDIAIKSVAKILSSSLRTNDVICRYGGEEFCILLIDINFEQATNVAERMRRTVKFNAGLAIREPSDIKITSSFGVSSIKSWGSANNPEELVDQADKALYESKKNGRNLVSCYSLGLVAKAG